MPTGRRERRWSRRSGSSRGPELRRLHDAILRQDPSLDVEPVAAELARELDASASPPLIGRDRELRGLRARWRRAAGGAGALVTIAGAYGMGKTRLRAAGVTTASRTAHTASIGPG